MADHHDDIFNHIFYGTVQRGQDAMKVRRVFTVLGQTSFYKMLYWIKDKGSVLAT